MHYFPSDETLRQKWTWFVRIHRKDLALCSAHFDESCFHTKGIGFVDEEGNLVQPKQTLIAGSIPTRDAVTPYTPPLTSRKHQMVSTAKYSWYLSDLQNMFARILQYMVRYAFSVQCISLASFT